MAGYVGARREIALTLETTRGTLASASSGDWQPHFGFDFGPKIERAMDNAGVGRIEENSGSVIIKEWSEGSIPLYLTEENAEIILRMLFGQAPTGAGSTASPYAYALLNNNEHDAYTVTVSDPIKGATRYNLGLADTIDLEFVTDDYCKATLSVLAGKEATTTSTPAYSTTDHKFIPSEVQVYFADNYAGLATASEVVVQNLTVSIAKNLEQKFVIGQTNPYDAINQRINITGDFTKLYEDVTYRALGLADTEKAMRVKVINSDSNYVQLDFPKVKLTDWNEGEDLDAYMEETFGFEAYRDDTNGLVVGTLVNEN